MVILLEKYLETSAHIGLYGALIIGSWDLFYVCIGTILNALGWLNLPYPFLSLESDPVFIIKSAAVGLFICQSTGSLLLYHLLIGFDDGNSEFAVLMGFIGLGFGGTLLRITVPTALRIALTLV